MRRWGVVVALAGALGVLAGGCNEECVDVFDCQEKRGDPGAGMQWLCIDNTCESRPFSPSPGRDAGTDAGVDAGMDGG